MQKQELLETLNEITQISELKDIHLFTDSNHREPVNNIWGYYTHVPYLYKACKQMSSLHQPVNVLELGMGIGSSSIFSYFSNKFPMNIVSIETNKERFKHCTETYYKNTEIKYYYHTSYEQKYDDNFFNNKTYDLIFIDQGSWEDRNKSILFYINKTNSFIVHDYDYNLRTWPETHNLLFKKFNKITWNEEWQNEPLTTPPTAVFEICNE